VKAEVVDTFGFDPDETIQASGKTGIGVKEILDAIVERIPPPDKINSKVYTLENSDIEESNEKTVKALIFDAFYHEYKGVTALVKVLSGELKDREKLYLMGTQTKIEPIEIGYLTPKMNKGEKILEGEVEYVATGLKDINLVHSGDTVTLFKEDGSHISVTPLKGYQFPKPMVFASLYPVDASDFPNFREALERLSLNDAALTYQKEYSQALGTGFVCGFLGLLHLEVTMERLEKEYNIDLISTTPTTEFQV